VRGATTTRHPHSVISVAVPEEEADFGERFGDGYFGAPLPPEDRLWRHPSELVGSTAAVPRRTNRPASRASALSAGIAGAMLATGLVLVGTHLATAFDSSATPQNATSASFSTTTSVVHDAMRPNSPEATNATNVSSDLAAMAARIGEATVLVTATNGVLSRRGAGLVIAPQCIVLTSYSLVDGAQSLSLTLPDGEHTTARLLGADPATGIAVLRCPATALKTIEGTAGANVDQDELIALVTFASNGAVELDFGLVRSPEAQVDTGSDQLLDEIETDIPSPPQGSALVGYDGVVGLVVGTTGGSAVATPTWLAMEAASQIETSGKVETGVLGITGGDAARQGGVKVLSVAPDSAAAAAGIKRGDVIESIDGGATPTMLRLQAKLHCLPPGTPVQIGLVQGGKDLDTEAVLHPQAPRSQAPAA
jgi:S1-C subfamily serine protease